MKKEQDRIQSLKRLRRISKYEGAEKIIEKITLLRLYSGMSRSNLETATGISRKRLKRIESYKTEASICEVIKILKIFDYTLKCVLTESENWLTVGGTTYIDGRESGWVSNEGI